MTVKLRAGGAINIIVLPPSSLFFPHFFFLTTADNCMRNFNNGSGGGPDARWSISIYIFRHCTINSSGSLFILFLIYIFCTVLPVFIFPLAAIPFLSFFFSPENKICTYQVHNIYLHHIRGTPICNIIWPCATR